MKIYLLTSPTSGKTAYSTLELAKLAAIKEGTFFRESLVFHEAHEGFHIANSIYSKGSSPWVWSITTLPLIERIESKQSKPLLLEKHEGSTVIVELANRKVLHSCTITHVSQDLFLVRTGVNSYFLSDSTGSSLTDGHPDIAEIRTIA